MPFITGRIPNIKLHYFECKVYAENKKDSDLNRTYNIFNLESDFWKLLKASSGVPPINQYNVLYLDNKRKNEIK